MRFEISHAKAHGSLGMGVNSRLLGDRLKDRQHFISALSTISQGNFCPVPGGVLILKNITTNNEGKNSEETEDMEMEKKRVIIGAIGVSGDTSDKDEFVAITALKVWWIVISEFLKITLILI